MNKFVATILLAVVSVAVAEPPVGYAYSQPSFSSHGGSSYSVGGGGGFSSFGGSGFGGGLGAGFGGGYRAVSHGYQTSEGKHVDPQLLHKVKEILLDQENHAVAAGGSGFGGGHGYSTLGGYSAPSSVYGVPSSSYGVPHYSSRVVGIELGHVQQGIQVAQYHQAQHVPVSSYSVPSGSYGVPSIPSGSYGVPSGSYGVPH